MKTAFLEIRYLGMDANEITQVVHAEYPWANFWVYCPTGLQCFAELHDAQIWADCQGV